MTKTCHSRTARLPRTTAPRALLITRHMPACLKLARIALLVVLELLHLLR